VCKYNAPILLGIISPKRKLQGIKVSLSSMSLGLLRNEDAARSDKLMGAKAQAVRNILNMSETARQQIMHTVSTFGWDGVLLVEVC
jgi:hypothetical protein